jgi:hypothetical protein
MKKIYLLILICLFFQIKAQHTLTAAFNPVAGDVDNSSSLDTTGLFLGSSGLSQTWNYTGVTITPFTAASFTYVPMSSVPNNFMFPGGTIASDDGAGNYLVFSNTSAKIEEMGQANATASNCVLYTDPIKYYSVPFSFGSSSFDTFSISVPSSYTVTGNVTTTGDATGVLQLPSGNYSNVLKLKFDVIENVSAPSYFATYTVTESRYYSPLSKFPLLVVTYQTYTSTAGPGFNKSGQINSLLATSITNHTAEGDITFFPNPVTNGELTIRDPKTQVNCASINNLLGQNIKTNYFDNRNISDNKKIDLSDLPKGIYYLQLSGKEISQTKKIIIE